ncbi:hypothetical protein [Nonomuraea endophytica]|uniref:GNAT family N-acetyltransferase n=1 Tax=Nonomuraea endophytica TaxID=714136 RepID=A0A7W8A4D4_9ACTN|nr:hypothetical protein [Nonomuraea endophytica]MBB5078516.1 hypothetical protein [Nonomuraea endophytica]
MNVRRAGAHEAEAVAELIATAFAELKVVRYLVPEPERRQRVMAANFRIFAEHGMMEHHHAALGTTPAYLEAGSARALYARHGYEVRQPFAMRDGTLFWPMWRAAP